MMGKMEMELPDMYMMNRFMGTSKIKTRMKFIESHQYLFEGAQSKIPAPFNPKVGVSFPGGVCMYQCASCGTETRGRGELHILT